MVDDHLMQITQVIRAEEWLSSTPKHVVLYQAFGWQAPEWVHMPLLRNADKSKISKRKNPVSLDYYQDAGFLPEGLLNYLGTMGWSISGDREKFTLDEMVEAFTFDRVSLGGPVFDLVKLSAMNAGYLRALSDGELVRRLRAWRLSDEKLASLVPLVRERIQRLDEFVPMTDFFFSGDVDYAPVAKELAVKNRTPKDVTDLLTAFGEELDAARDFSTAGLDALARAFAEKSGWSTKELFMLLRLAATGKKATPPLFETLAGLGRELVRRRIRQCTELHQKDAGPPRPEPPRRRRVGGDAARRRSAGRLRPLPVLLGPLSLLRLRRRHARRDPARRLRRRRGGRDRGARPLVRGRRAAGVDLFRRGNARALAAGRARARARGGARDLRSSAGGGAGDHRRGQPGRDGRRAALRASAPRA